MSTRRSLEDVLLRRTITPVAKPRHIFSPNEASSQQQLNHLRHLSAVMPVRKLTTVLSTTRTKIETLLLTKELIFFDRPPLIGAEHTPYYASDSIRMFLSKKVSEVQNASQRIVDLCHVPYVLPDGYSGVHVAVLQQRAWKSFMTHSDMLHHSRHDSLRGLTFIFRVLSFVLPSSGSGVSLEDRRPIIHRFQVTRDGPSNNRGGGFVEITRTTRATIHLPGPMVQNSSIIPTDSYDNASRGRNVDVEVLTLKISALVTNRDSSVQQQGICLPPIAWLLRRADGGEYGPIVHCPRPMVQLIGLHVPNVWEIQRDSESVQTQTPKSRIMVSSVDDDVMRFVNEWKR